MDERATALTCLLRVARDRRAAVAGIAAALGAIGREEADASQQQRRRRRRRDRCHRVRQTCNRASDCCNTLACEPVDGLPGEHCCRRQREGCSGDDDCCGFLFCTPGGACDVPDSDRALKANFASVDAGDLLARVSQLPIAGWCAAGGGAVEHRMRPHPGAFAATFGVGGDETRIHVLDGQGVVLAAIQGAARQMDELRAEAAALRARIEALGQGN